MTTTNILTNTHDGTAKVARTVDPFEFQYLVWNEKNQTTDLYVEHTDKQDIGMEWASQLKFDKRVLFWDWICHYADGSSEFVMRSMWLDGNVPEDTRCLR